MVAVSQFSIPIPGSSPRNGIARPGLHSLAGGDGLKWFCLRAEGRREHIAAMNLVQRMGVEAFAPRIRVRKEKRRGGVMQTTEALFPGYLFARFDYQNQCRHVISARGVVGLVAFGGQPPSLPDDTMTQLRQYSASESSLPVSPIFEEGQWVRVAAGCFRGSQGKVLNAVSSGQSRICVLLNLLGHDVEISLPGDQLIGLGRSAAHAPGV